MSLIYRLVPALTTAVVAGIFSTSSVKGSDFSTLYGKHLAGYQGWFGCPADGVGWFHWFKDNKPSPGNIVVDMMPDISGLEDWEKCNTKLKSNSGKDVYLFSSRNPNVVREHFRWMREYGLDGVALQRFASALAGRQGNFTNAVLKNVWGAAEAEQRGFFIMYDLSGTDPLIDEKVMQDWKMLSEMGVPRSRSYLHHQGKPVVGLWGAGFIDRGITYSQISRLLQYFREQQHSATIIGGVPMYWRTLGRDSRQDADWGKIYRSYDVVSPWSVGRLHNLGGLDAYLQSGLRDDLEEVSRLGKEYMPVQYPGMSFHNATRGKLKLNNISRECGEFYRRYGRGLLNAGVKMIYTAMFDEVNEGTAIFKVSSSREQAPVNSTIASLSDDGCVATSDMYLKIAGEQTKRLHMLMSR